ncbi:MAG: endonuclease III [Elusimicrobia bacterium RIFCSPLOWO2_02_FULL_39_32]|nr:MAG: endonuclease III [Elusimicrobia bacterium GWA2_38_7]OGR80123.1 MAG: endonuclease III [Elusimicrobia bacterium RIFCSPHIGHO2_02_FULL_39_36]OGR91082.1 MAG: endonuclease III [Elusimicrobia bacterium RIFCSPLOWO2_02_FULL_39_32]OGS00049.1 MAG: endonuclease III [Elusimicrobia bacterium RIFCSPLOWO2_12_FULL_39_28]
MVLSKKIKEILKILKSNYPEADCALNYSNPLQLLISTILSAQCTDKRVNQVTKTLFKKYKSIKDFSNLDRTILEKEIRSTGFFRQKAKWIQESCKKIEQDFHGQVPKTMELLTSLPGVARKTANVVMGTAFNIASGIVVDTHVKRISKRLGLTKKQDPVKIEEDLMKIIPQENWIWFSHALITHGRALCKAIRPLCSQCPLNNICPSSLV